jgi:hypothetical protein
MAIDSFAKRASAAGVGMIGRSIVVPDGSDLESGQRRVADGLYLGIADIFEDAATVSTGHRNEQRRNLLLR